jgi:hypothetical protein
MAMYVRSTRSDRFRWRNNAENAAIADNAVDGERETGAFLIPPTSHFGFKK